jgi:cytochrome P450
MYDVRIVRSYTSQLGRGLLTADGDDHKRQRRIISPGFSSIKIKEYAEIFRDCTEKVLGALYVDDYVLIVIYSSSLTGTTS